MWSRVAAVNRPARSIGWVDPNSLGLLLIAVSVGASVVWLVTRNRPRLRMWSRLSGLAIVVILVGVAALLGSAFLQGWYGGIPD
jgi:hypothetical protein